jgi:opacity protein-like surface antigen
MAIDVIVPDSARKTYESWHFAPAVRHGDLIFFSGVVAQGDSAEDEFRTAWQALGKVNYHINECWDVAVGYRYQYVDYEKDGFVFDSSTQGAVIGVSYNF